MHKTKFSGQCTKQSIITTLQEDFVVFHVD